MEGHHNNTTQLLGMAAQSYPHSTEPPSSSTTDLCNNGGMFANYEDFTQINAVWWSFVVLYALVIALSLVGNLMVIWTICRYKYMRTVTNYYILNLAVCDFLVCVFVMPLKLMEYAGTCVWKMVNVDILCSALSYILPVFVFASVFTLVAISLERYHAIVHPFESRKIHSKARTIRIILFTWLAALILPTPYLFCKSFPFSITSDYGTISRLICTDRFDEIDAWMFGQGARASGKFRQGFFVFLFLAIYLIPAVIIVATCIRISFALLKPWSANQSSMEQPMENRVSRRQEENKRKVARMIIIVALTFIVSWSPFYLVTIVSQFQKNSFLRHSNFIFTMLATHLCGFINSSINPIVYHAMSDRFRKSFQDIWYRLLRLVFCGSKIFLPQRQPRSTASWSGSSRRSGTGSSVVTTYCTNIAMDDMTPNSPTKAYSALSANNYKGNTYSSSM